MSDATRCTWCQKHLNGSSAAPRRFCTQSHATAFHDACRRAGVALFDGGGITIDQLRAIKAIDAAAPAGAP